MAKTNREDVKSLMSTTFEKHYTPEALGKLWSFSGNTIREMFRNEPGVIKVDHRETRSKRNYCSMRIPASVAQKVYARLQAR